MRTYFITLRTAGGLLIRDWITTNCIAAMQFTHSFGTVGFGLYSKHIEGQKEINNVEPI